MPGGLPPPQRAYFGGDVGALHAGDLVTWTNGRGCVERRLLMMLLKELLA